LFPKLLVRNNTLKEVVTVLSPELNNTLLERGSLQSSLRAVPCAP